MTIQTALALVGLVSFGIALGGAGVWLWSRSRLAQRSLQERIVTQHITERVRAVGRLVGLEVCAKEIATATSGWAWLPPLLLSQARLAMIFHFQKQYFVDLARLRADDIAEIAPGKVRITLPPVEGALRLTDFTPYDIQHGRVLGLLDVIPMNAERQQQLMKRAQSQAAELYEVHDARYREEAKASIERHLRSLLDMFGISAEIDWDESGQIRDTLPFVDPARASA